MSRIAAILRKEGKIIPPLPIDLWDDFYLSNLLTSSSKYEVLIKEQVETELFETLSDIEHNSLVLHNDLAFTNEELEYRESIGEELPKEYKATHLKFNYETDKYEYRDDFRNHESWSSMDNLISGLSKLLVMIELEKKIGIQTPWNGAYLEENIRDLKLLLTGLKNVQSETGAEEALLVVKYN